MGWSHCHQTIQILFYHIFFLPLAMAYFFMSRMPVQFQPSQPLSKQWNGRREGSRCSFFVLQNLREIPQHTPAYVSVSSVQFSHSVVSDSLRPQGLQHARPPCPSPTPRVHSNSCPLNWWRHPTISSSVVPFSSCLQSFPALGSFPVSQLFAWGGQSIGVSASASVLPMNIQDWFPVRWTGWISLLSKVL